jgi:hypothetical protein
MYPRHACRKRAAFELKRPIGNGKSAVSATTPPPASCLPAACDAEGFRDTVSLRVRARGRHFVTTANAFDSAGGSPPTDGLMLAR